MIFHWNACGIICALMTYGFMCYADYVVVVWLVAPTFLGTIWEMLHILGYNMLVFLAVFAHIRAMTTDPGIVPYTMRSCKSEQAGRKKSKRESSEEDDDEEVTDSDSDNETLIKKMQFVGEDWTICTRCDSFRPPRAHHCRVCHRCIRRMDHHCPWVNNCVGEFNQKYFLQFVFYVAALAIYSIVLIITSWMLHDQFGVTGERGPSGRNNYHLKVVHSICLTIESALFGLFVIAVSCDQLQAIFNDETVVEAFYRRGGIRRRLSRSKCSLLRDVCGPGHWSLWALPCNSLPYKRELVRFANQGKLNV